MPQTEVSKATRRNRRKICADAVAKMNTVVSDMEEWGDADVEVKTLRKQLRRIERVSDTIDAMEEELEAANANAEIALDGDPKETAQKLVALIPLDQISQDKVLMDAFLSEMFLAVATASTKKKRNQKAAEGIAAAKARGVHFGRERIPVPDGFEEVLEAWRDKEINSVEAGKLCGFSKDTFLRMAHQAEQEGDENRYAEETQRISRQRRSSASI